MTRLSINVNKIATLRNARGGNNPDLLRVAQDIEKFGAQGITVHPRPDERHIREQDVYDLAPLIQTEFNIEGYPDERFMTILERVKPDQATLVPDLPGVITSNAGWDTRSNLKFLKEVIARIKEMGIRASIFLDPNPEMVKTAAETGTDRVELYTEAYAVGYFEDREKAILPYVTTAETALAAGLELNAGHDLDLHNLKYFHDNIPGLEEVSIGHALVCDSLYFGLENTVQLYLRQLG